MSEDADTSPPITVSSTKRVSLPLLMLIGLIGATVSATIGWTALQADVRAAGVSAAEASRIARAQDERVRALEKAQIQIAEMARDVEWIKRTLQEDRRRE